MKNLLFEHFTFQNEREIPTRNLCRRRDWNAQGIGQKINYLLVYIFFKIFIVKYKSINLIFYNCYI